MRRLIQLSAFWRTDQQQGIIVDLTKHYPNLDDVLAKLTHSYDAMYGEAVRRSRVAEFLTDLYAQLEVIGSMDKSKPLPHQNRLLAMGAIWLLERYGFLEPDEFNGLMLEYED